MAKDDNKGDASRWAIDFREAAELTAEVALGKRVLDVLERDRDVSLNSLIASFQADIDGYTGDQPERSLVVVQGRAIIDRLRKAAGSG